MNCRCAEIGADGTKGHTGPSGIRFAHCDGALEDFEPCSNHVGNYRTSIHFKIIYISCFEDGSSPDDYLYEPTSVQTLP